MGSHLKIITFLQTNFSCFSVSKIINNIVKIYFIWKLSFYRQYNARLLNLKIVHHCPVIGVHLYENLTNISPMLLCSGPKRVIMSEEENNALILTVTRVLTAQSDETKAAGIYY
ncbi:uncharacterized protein LOC143032765 isoform X1 [Oratosquilla oratoria]|uniref:uncharacterized protein LOC143032765 isoform X1 n=1 Tax=Oratosquilla oratoria TaxID=337810 RepID=UPI003F757264